MAYTIWLTEACNLRCKYCYEGIEKKHIHMTKETAQQTITYILNDISNMKKTEHELLINFHGGEPFLNFETMEYFVNQISESSLVTIPAVFTVTTNGTIFNEEIIDFILHNKLEPTFSIDGTAKTHNLI